MVDQLQKRVIKSIELLSPENDNSATTRTAQICELNTIWWKYTIFHETQGNRKMYEISVYQCIKYNTIYLCV